MAYTGLKDFVADLEKKDQLLRIKAFVDPVLEITEITDRITKSGGKALLFENNGTDFPVLINGFGSDDRMAWAIGRNTLGEVGEEIDSILKSVSDNTDTFFKKLTALPELLKLAGYLPSRSGSKGSCQQVIHRVPDLGILPVLKCWPYDGGRFITLPMVHTIHPETGKPNVGMYRMQVLDKNTTAMHWQRHKTGANHYEAWKKAGKKMPVSVALGGDPVYTYSATAPLPENLNEYILAGFLRKKKVKMVRCITNELFVPYDADIVIEGYVDPKEELIWEGPFGDHTGFYSLADWYPKFHITCITHSKSAVYPATIVGVPPQEDAWLAKATERIFLSPVKLSIQPEIEDFHMPSAGIAHNLVVVKIKKDYPGQGMKVISSLLGAGQMMFTKYLVVVSGEINIRNYKELLIHMFSNTDFSRDVLFCSGPLDVLDHSSDTFSFGGKAGFDATVKHAEECFGRRKSEEDFIKINESSHFSESFKEMKQIETFNILLLNLGIPVLILAVNRTQDSDVIERVSETLKSFNKIAAFQLILIVDHTIDVYDYEMVAWQILGNSDPKRDHKYISPSTLLIDGTIKAYRTGGFSRKWPNVVCSGNETISIIDNKWKSLDIGSFIHSPSIKSRELCRNGRDEIIIDKDEG